MEGKRKEGRERVRGEWWERERGGWVRVRSWEGGSE